MVATEQHSRETIDLAKTLGEYLPDGPPTIEYPLSDHKVVELLRGEFDLDRNYLAYWLFRKISG
jgi:hypothetical protein